MQRGAYSATVVVPQHSSFARTAYLRQEEGIPPSHCHHHFQNESRAHAIVAMLYEEIGAKDWPAHDTSLSPEAENCGDLYGGNKRKEIHQQCKSVNCIPTYAS